MSDWLTVHIGDCRDVLPTLDAGSVHCVVTSPPYWGLRDYGTASWDGGDAACDHVGPPMRTNNKPSDSAATFHGGTNRGTEPWRNGICGKCGATRVDRQLGLERTPEAYVANLVAVFREVWRVLRDDGTVWLNLGDSYAGSGKGAFGTEEARDAYRPKVKEVYVPTRAEAPTAGVVPLGLKPKDLVGIPWRVAFALQADGWYLRSDIIWSKPNPMPESVTDRPTKSHEYLFLLSKRPRYYFDQDAVREPTDGRQHPAALSFARETKEADVPGQSARQHRLDRKQDAGQQVSGGDRMTGFNERYFGAEPPAGRNIRSVWSIATQPYPGAHFAVFPEALVEPCIKAGTSERGVCVECGAPWERVVERAASDMDARYRRGEPTRHGLNGAAASQASNVGGFSGIVATTGWRPTCAHDAEPVPGVVLDPFGGSGTVGKVANKLSRRAVLIELNPEYGEQIAGRNLQAPLGLVG